MPEVIFIIIQNALNLDVHSVREYTSYLADELEDSDQATAGRLRRLLEPNGQGLELRPKARRIAEAEKERKILRLRKERTHA